MDSAARPKKTFFFISGLAILDYEHMFIKKGEAICLGEMERVRREPVVGEELAGVEDLEPVLAEVDAWEVRSRPGREGNACVRNAAGPPPINAGNLAMRLNVLRAGRR